MQIIQTKQFKAYLKKIEAEEGEEYRKRVYWSLAKTVEQITHYSKTKLLICTSELITVFGYTGPTDTFIEAHFKMANINYRPDSPYIEIKTMSGETFKVWRDEEGILDIIFKSTKKNQFYSNWFIREHSGEDEFCDNDYKLFAKQKLKVIGGNLNGFNLLFPIFQKYW